MKVKILKFHPDARIPKKAYDKDFCYDVYAVSEEEIAPNVWKYGLGFGLQIERGNELFFRHERRFQNFVVDADEVIKFQCSPINLSIDIRPRSSVWKTGMVLSNCQGTVN